MYNIGRLKGTVDLLTIARLLPRIISTCQLGDVGKERGEIRPYIWFSLFRHRALNTEIHCRRPSWCPDVSFDMLNESLREGNLPLLLRVRSSVEEGISNRARRGVEGWGGGKKRWKRETWCCWLLSRFRGRLRQGGEEGTLLPVTWHHWTSRPLCSLLIFGSSSGPLHAPFLSFFSPSFRLTRGVANRSRTRGTDGRLLLFRLSLTNSSAP